MDEAALLPYLRSHIGDDVEPPVVADEPVNRAMVRNWCEAMGDTNPVYLDASAAARSRHGGLVAPPTMIQAWFFPTLGTVRPPAGSLMSTLVQALRDAGYTSLVATDSDQRYVRYVRHGELLTRRTTLAAVSDRKTTRLGAGFFVNTEAVVTTDGGDLICVIGYRRFYFRPLDQP
jgi:uncharacterized protein